MAWAKFIPGGTPMTSVIFIGVFWMKSIGFYEDWFWPHAYLTAQRTEAMKELSLSVLHSQVYLILTKEAVKVCSACSRTWKKNQQQNTQLPPNETCICSYCLVQHHAMDIQQACLHDTGQHPAGILAWSLRAEQWLCPLLGFAVPCHIYMSLPLPAHISL